MAQSGYTPILIYASGTATNVPLAANMTSSASGAELALNYADGKLYYKNSSGVVTLLASAAGASGDVVGPSSATDNALARFDTTTGKLIQNSVGILSDAGVLTGLTGLTSSGNITLSSLTATRVPYASTGGLLVDSANMTFDGTKLTVAGLKDSALTSGRVTYATTSGELTDSANLTFDGTTLTANALTVSNAVTLSGGTANGVTYLNGSKVLTSGSALTFDGTNLSTVQADGYNGLRVTNTSGKIRISGYVNGTIGSYIDSLNAAESAYTTLTINGNPLVYQINGSEQMRLTSTGLGVGTSTIPTVGSTTVLAVGNGSGGTLGIVQSGSIAYRISASTSGVDCYNPNSSPISWYTAGTSRLTLDAAGNFGVGVTPQARLNVQYADSAPTASGTISSGVVFQYAAGGVALNMGSSSGGYVYFNSAFANNAAVGQAYRFYQGATQTMTLDASGNLAVGATSATTRLLIFSGAGGNLANFSDGTQNLIIGTASGSVGYVNGASGVLGLYTSGIERARIDSSGNLLVGTTSSSGLITSVQASTSAASVFANASSASYTGNVLDIRTGTAAGTGFTLIAGTSNAATVFQVLGNGNVRNTNNSYGAISDIKLKENIVDATPKLADLMQVKVRNFNLIGSTTKQIGVVAQELETVFPAMVDETPDRDADNNVLETTTKSVKYSVFVPMLIKAIQEQQAIIESLKARLDAANL